MVTLLLTSMSLAIGAILVGVCFFVVVTLIIEE